MRRTPLAVSVLVCWLGLLLNTSQPAAVEDGPVEKAAVEKAIEQGVVYLKSQQLKNGSWGSGDGGGFGGLGGGDGGFNYMDVGVTALSALALLECGVPVKDECLQSAAEYLRKANQEMTFTHALGASILFLDRVGDSKDELLIRTMGARLLAGQARDGGWGYTCPKLMTEDVRKLKPDQFEKGVAQLARKAATQQGGGFAGFGFGGMTENSCSEFAVMGLWTSRRYGVPVANVLKVYEKACRGWQNSDGSFPYSAGMRGGGGLNWGTACMTCAGLMGLAHCHGSANEVTLQKYAKSKEAPPALGKNGMRDPVNDPALKKGLVALEARIKGENPFTKAQKQQGKMGAFAIGGFDQGGVFPGESFGYMAMWSLERVAVVYNLDKVGKIDWYNWGARRLLDQQAKDGSWGTGNNKGFGGIGGGKLDSAFALLFLRRANPSDDLFLTLKGVLPPPRTSSATPEAPDK